MKKLIVVILCLFVLSAVNVMARQFESVVDVNVTTYTIAGDDYSVAGIGLLISSATPRSLIKEIEISNEQADLVRQTVTLYDNFSADASSANVTAIWSVTIGSGTVGGTNWTYSKSFYGADRGLLKADYGLGARKSSTAGTVSISIQYK